MKDPTLAVILPCYQERPNVRPMVARLATALAGIDYEVIYVDDDSPDGTADEVRAVRQLDPRVRVIQRIGRRGLSSACLEGMMATEAPYMVVMDADMQHDEAIVPRMLELIQRDQLDVVIGTRHADAGGMGEFSAMRVQLSNWGKRLSDLVCGVSVSDPMTGFFMIHRGFLSEVIRLVSGTGFKILVDLLASAPRPVKVGEVGYTFRNREHGESKLDLVVSLEYLQLLLDKALHGLLPARYVLFCAVGATGVVVHMVLVKLLLSTLGFGPAQLVAGLVAMIGNFLLNNWITFRGNRLKGWRILLGLLLFCLSCGVGLYANAKVASALVQGGAWWVLASLVGIVLGSVWNYGITSLFVWRLAERSRRVRSLRLAGISPANQAYSPGQS